MTNIIVISYTKDQIPYNTKEIYRYLNCKESKDMDILIKSCIDEINSILTYKVCYRECTVCIDKKHIDLEFCSIESEHLSKNLQNCNNCIIFAATIGLELDRLICRYSELSPSRAVVLQAIGTERIENLCNRFCEDIQKQYLLHNKYTNPRFSPGYGDVDLGVQKDIFRILDCSKHIGIMLNNNLYMSPSKSVTAFIGVRNND